jgi:1-acyl-sn-glycerol-3-phosphate acyltransferase
VLGPDGHGVHQHDNKKSLRDSLRVFGIVTKVVAPSFGTVLTGGMKRDVVDMRARKMGQNIIDTLDIHLTIHGAENVPRDRAVIYMSNHQSTLDIPILFAALPSPTLRMIAKKEMFKIPIWGTVLKSAEFIPIDRGNHEKAKASCDKATESLRSGVSIWMAPEGTRSKDGTVSELKKGGFHMAVQTGAPIVPVTITGTWAIMPPGTKKMRTGQAVHVEIGHPIDPRGKSVAELIPPVHSFLVQHARATVV